MSDLSELIEIIRNIEKQNTEIIRLLKKIAGEDEISDKLKKQMELLSFTPDFGDFDSHDNKIDEEPEEIENDFQIGDILETSIDVGEVYFIEGSDIFRLSIKNNETSIDNLTGDSKASEFKLQELAANESIKNDVSLDDGTVILNSQQSLNLPESLRICVEQGAKKVYIPIFASTQLINAPQSLMRILKLNFYKSDNELIEKLFQ